MSHYSEKHYIPSKEFDRFYYNLFFKKGDKILDIGCSTGNFIVQDSKNIIGIDIDMDAIKIARKRSVNAIHQKNPKKLPFRNETFNNVHSRHVLEHLEEPLGFMKEIARVLKKNGRLILFTDKPNKHFWDDYTHVQPHTKKSLEQLACDAGFRRFKLYDFPLKGIFGVGFLFKYKIISARLAKRIYYLCGKIFKQDGLILEAVK
ncbi:hypothetical protein CMO83_03820 [Candidatus Woesearchaeota archaeon]|nr:hypothetical protein [Candidatus Woesearchaeota archaeon]|tara:strand:- start:292 stop:903 length:612 start_codon:yes stop_codon:yes gene_type:complete